MKTYQREKGFVLFIVIFAMILFGIAVVLLTSCLQTLSAETRRTELDAQAEMIQSSAYQWALQNQDIIFGSDQTIFQPDMSVLGIRDADCTIQILDQRSNVASLRITCSCSGGRRRISRQRDYTF